jgi:hypothetical protein
MSGIVVKCTAWKKTTTFSSFPIECNYIEGSTHHGITCEGHLCCPNIIGNTIEGNRKTGIKLAYCARAHIGGDGENCMELSAILDLCSYGEEIGGQDDKLYKESLETYSVFFDEENLNQSMMDDE